MLLHFYMTRLAVAVLFNIWACIKFIADYGLDSILGIDGRKKKTFPIIICFEQNPFRRHIFLYSGIYTVFIFVCIIRRVII